MTWVEWMKLHGNLFALRSAEDAEMIGDWVDGFKKAGFCPAELADATRKLAFREERCTRWEQVQALSALVRAARADAARETSRQRQRDQESQERESGKSAWQTIVAAWRQRGLSGS